MRAAIRKPSAGREPLTGAELGARLVGFLVLWIVLIGPSLADLGMGIVAAAVATWASVALWPPAARLSTGGIAYFALRFLWQSIVAGLDVARRAFAPRLRLKPGFTTCRTSVSAGLARDAFCAAMSLQPGRLPVDMEPGGAILIHCLDVDEPAAIAFSQDEAAFARIWRREARND
jgi:multicomponent Na+:H+ antiporter subunit E